MTKCSLCEIFIKIALKKPWSDRRTNALKKPWSDRRPHAFKSHDLIADHNPWKKSCSDRRLYALKKPWIWPQTISFSKATQEIPYSYDPSAVYTLEIQPANASWKGHYDILHTSYRAGRRSCFSRDTFYRCDRSWETNLVSLKQDNNQADSQRPISGFTSFEFICRKFL